MLSFLSSSSISFAPLIVITILLPCPIVNGQVIFLNTTMVPNVKWQPSGLGQFRVGDQRTLLLLINSNETAWSGPVELTCEYVHGCPMEECTIMHSIQLDKSNEFSQSINISLRATGMGLNRIFARISRKQFWYRVRTWKTPLGSTLTRLFIWALGIAIFAGNFMAGLQMDLAVIGKFSSALALASICQFLLIPLISFGIAKYALMGHPFVMRLAFFMVGTTPVGAGKSSFWSVLFDGNLELVSALSFVQHLGTVVFMPLWLHFVGHRAFFVERVHVPFNVLGYGLALMIGPYLLGLLMTWIGARELVQRGVKCIKVFLWIGTILFLCIAIPTIWPNLRLLTWDLLLCIGLALPCAAHLVAFLLCRIFGLNPRDARTITIECGIQSSGITAFILLLSLGEPERDVALAIPVAFALLTDKPLLALCMSRIGGRAVAILKRGGQTATGGDKVAPTGVEEENSANGQKQSNKMADLLELKLNRIKQLDELAVRTTMARRLPPIH